VRALAVHTPGRFGDDTVTHCGDDASKLDNLQFA
jgi:hypothetical protein